MLGLDTIISATFFFSGTWTPALRRNQSRDVLRLVLYKLYAPPGGSLFHRHARSSHAALAASCSLSREWVCTLIGRLREAGWLETTAPRLPDGKQEITSFRPGRMLKRLLVMLLRSRQRHKSRANDCGQKAPTREQVEKNLHFLRELQESLAHKLAPPGGQRGR
jgi:hypothetical protein